VSVLELFFSSFVQGKKCTPWLPSLPNREVRRFLENDQRETVEKTERADQSWKVSTQHKTAVLDLAVFPRFEELGRSLAEVRWIAVQGHAKQK
jgi:hypothetical protein